MVRRRLHESCGLTKTVETGSRVGLMGKESGWDECTHCAGLSKSALQIVQSFKLYVTKTFGTFIPVLDHLHIFDLRDRYSLSNRKRIGLTWKCTWKDPKKLSKSCSVRSKARLPMKAV